MLCLDCKRCEHILLPVAACHHPTSAGLGTYCRAHLLNKLHVASEVERPLSLSHYGWEEENTIVQCWLLETIKVSTGPEAGDVASHRHCHYHCQFILHIEKRVLIFWVISVSWRAFYTFTAVVPCPQRHAGCIVMWTSRKMRKLWPPSSSVQRQGWGPSIAEFNAQDQWELRRQYVINSWILISVILAVRWNNSSRIHKNTCIYVSVSGGSIWLHISMWTNSLPQLSRNNRLHWVAM